MSRDMATTARKSSSGLVYVPGGLFKSGGSAISICRSTIRGRMCGWKKPRCPPIPPYGYRGLAFGVSGAIDGKLYVLGTCLESGSWCGEAFERYDPATNQWTLLTLPPVVPTSNRAAGVLNKKFYVTDGKVLRSLRSGDQQVVAEGPDAERQVWLHVCRSEQQVVCRGWLLRWHGERQSRCVRSCHEYVDEQGTHSRVEAGLSAGRVVVNGQARLEVVGGASHRATTCSTCHSKMALALSLLGRG